MAEQNKIQYIDLIHELNSNTAFPLFGREKEQNRAWRTTQKTISNNCLVVGPRGIGKTALIRSLASNAKAENKGIFVEFSTSSFFGMSNTKPNQIEDALNNLPRGIIVLENIQEIITKSESTLNQFSQIFSSLINSKDHSVIFSADEEFLFWLESQSINFLHNFEVLNLKPLSEEEEIKILKNLTAKLNITEDIIETAVKLAQRFKRLGALPASALNLFEESLNKDKSISKSTLLEITAEKLGLPLSQLKGDDTSLLVSLERELQKKVIAQDSATSKIAGVIARSRLGLKNPNRPLGSFLLLGPSGVGKTETAKALTELVFANQNMVRLDMSEFSEAHTAQRLIGSPPGYVGYEEGGALTNAVSKDPYCLILLDELEKAHGRVFDLFLQILDEGRLTSGAGVTVDFTNTIIIATSNAGVDVILEKYRRGQNLNNAETMDAVGQALAKSFKPEFLNRFDAITIYKPFSNKELLDIAELEVKKVADRLKNKGLGFTLEKAELEKQISQLCDPKFGARPIKRFVEETCETLISQALLAQKL